MEIPAAGATSLRPWSDVISLSTISLPLSLSDLSYRLSSNLNHFRLNYINISLIFLFLSLLFHPFAVILLLLTAAAWFYFLVNRQDPLIILDRTIDDRAILAVLFFVTVLALFLANVWANVFASLAVSAVFIFVIAGIRAPEDDQESPYGSLLSDNNSPRSGYTQR